MVVLPERIFVVKIEVVVIEAWLARIAMSDQMLVRMVAHDWEDLE